MSPSTKTQKLPYPVNLGDSDKPGFWVRAWMRDQAQVEALDRHINANFKRVGDPLLHALYAGLIYAKKDAKQAFDYIVKGGELLYAWPGSSIIQIDEVAA